MPTFQFQDTSLDSHIVGPKGFYSPATQEMANYFPRWMKLRKDISSVGQQLMAPMGADLQELRRETLKLEDSLHLPTSQTECPDNIYKYELDATPQLSISNPPHFASEYGTIPVITEENDFFFYTLPTRIEAVASGSLWPNSPVSAPSSGVQYDTLWLDSEDNEYPLYFDYSNNKLNKYYLKDIGLEKPTDFLPSREVVGSYDLADASGAPASGVLNGMTIHEDRIFLLLDNHLHIYDARIDLVKNIDHSWAGNKDVSTITALVSTQLPITINANPRLTLGERYRRDIFYYDDNQWIKYKLYYDYTLLDITTNIAFFHEHYSAPTIDGNAITQTSHDVFNYFDDWGIFLDTPRLSQEPNEEYKARLLNVMKFRANATHQGLINGVSQSFDTNFYGIFPSGENAYSSVSYNGEFPSGYPIYSSGDLASHIPDISRVDALLEPTVYNTLVDSSGNATSTMAEYTQEILETYPILWGSGEGDLISFRWDMTPFDGALNSSDKAPDFFSHMTSGVDRKWFQSGVSTPDSNDLQVRMAIGASGEWQAQVRRGDFYIHDRAYHVFAEEVNEYIPSGVTAYTISSAIEASQPIYITDCLGTTAPSGTQWLHVAASGTATAPYEFTIDGSGVIHIGSHNGLFITAETSGISEWKTLPWDFNPLHGVGYDGFIWISDTKQEMAGFTLNAFPEIIAIGGATTLIGRVLDSIGDPVVGATVYFVLPSGVPGTIYPPSATTQFDGSAYAAYVAPAAIGDVTASSINIAADISGIKVLYNKPIVSRDFSDMFTYTESADVSGYPTPVKTMVMTADIPNPKTLHIPSGINTDGWNYVSNNLYKYTMGGVAKDSADSFANIDLGSILINGAPVSDIPTTGFYYEIDSFTDPKDYGRIIVYNNATIDTTITYNAFKPAQPFASSLDPSGTWMFYTSDVAMVSGANMKIVYPTTIEISGYAIYAGNTSDIVTIPVSIGIGNEQMGVFRLDSRFIDFYSYLRIS